MNRVPFAITDIFHNVSINLIRNAYLFKGFNL